MDKIQHMKSDIADLIENTCDDLKSCENYLNGLTGYLQKEDLTENDLYLLCGEMLEFNRLIRYLMKRPYIFQSDKTVINMQYREDCKEEKKAAQRREEKKCA